MMLGAMKKRIFWTLSKLDKSGMIDQRRLIWDDGEIYEENDILDTF